MSLHALKYLFNRSLASWRFGATTCTNLLLQHSQHHRPVLVLSQIQQHHKHALQLSRAMASSSGSSEQSHQAKSNKLIDSKSPYLLQHAYNPVEWYPWGEEAFEKAKKENKLIFLSVGYSTCHWCHVMERESFESQEVAELMNKDFVNIKVDREERPDVDKMYMNFVQAISGSGGWPMSVWMTPDLKPVYGGTYYPPDDRYYGRPGFKSILKSLADQWKSNPAKFKNSGEKIVAMLSQSASLGRAVEIPPADHCTKLCFDQLERSYEPRYGGFSERPKFPQPVNLSFLMRSHVRGIGSRHDDQKALDMCLHTLRMMAKGGIFDHVGLGFARYSTDGQWHVPHFEKMLYDQAQLAGAYTDAYQLTRDRDLARVVRDIFTYTMNDMTDPSGGFYSAEDADSYPEDGAKEKREGAFCVWTWKEVRDVLADDATADIVCHHFDVRPNGNVDPYQDPHDELKGRNVLIVRGSVEETAAKFGRTADEVRSVLGSSLAKLKEARQRRPRPHLDDKMLAAWNGLMMSALAKAGVILEESAYVERAVRTAEFIQKHLFDAGSGRLLRSCYRGPDAGVRQNSPPIEGFLDDYAFIIRGLLDVYSACQDEKWLKWAEELQNKQDELFWDADDGGYFSSAAGDPNILIRLKDDQDGAEPSGNSIAVGNLGRLAAVLDSDEHRNKAEKILRLFGQRLAKFPVSLPEMVSGLQMHEDSVAEVVVVGSRASQAAAALWQQAVTHPKSLLGQVVVRFDPEADAGGWLAGRRPSLASMARDEPAAYVCRHRSCSAPVTSPGALKELLDA